MCGCYEISDRVILFDTQLSIEELETAKKDLEPKAQFYKGWIYLPNALHLGGYKGEKNEVAIKREYSLIPEDIRDTLSIPYRYSSDTSINHKSETKNPKPQIRNHTQKKEDVKPEDISEDDWLKWQQRR